MTAPANLLAFDLDIVSGAVSNWRARSGVREKAARSPERKYTAIETPERLAKRANRLLDQVRRATPSTTTSLPENLKELIDREPMRADEMSDVMMERIIGATRDFLSAAFLDKGVEAMRSVGRVVVQIDDGRASYGTGFLVSPQLLLTNWHVLPDPATAGNATVEFDYQLDRMDNPLRPERFALEPQRFFLNDQKLDFALVAVAGSSRGRKPVTDYDFCSLIGEEGKIVVTNCVNIVQHPKGEMKQVVIRENKVIDVLENHLHYEGDTEPGSSGSLVCNDQWEVVALHHSGVPATDGDGNLLAVDDGIWHPGDDPTRLKWVANEGIRVSKLVTAVRGAQLRPHEEPLRAELLNGASAAMKPQPVRVSDASPVRGTPESGGSGKPLLGNPMDNYRLSGNAGAVSVTIPLTITVSLGEQQLAVAMSPPTAGNATPNLTATTDGAAPVAAVENTPPEPRYDGRPGYDAEFLGFPAPLPRLSNSLRGKAVSVPGAARENPFELKYHHYSVIMNGDRRLAFVSAVNLDGAAPAKVERDGADQWFFDPRIPKEKQAGSALYSGNPLDRGHLTRRADAAWGATEQEAERANSDTFHWTNCSPQHEIFNQSSKASKAGLLLWGNLENHVAEQAHAERQRLSVFNGPVFRSDDRSYRGVRLPREFYKLIVYKHGSGKPGAAAFVLSQAELIENLPQEEFAPGEFKPFQIRIRDLESRTNLDFGNLRSFDPLEDSAKESFMEAGADHVLLRNPDDIVL